MDCITSNNSVNLKHQEGNENCNFTGNFCLGFATNGNDVEQINKATTSSSNPTEQGQEDQQLVQQPSMVTIVVNKGKRTKRQRLYSDSSSIPSSTFNHSEDDLVDEEQLDMAKVLILLAQGQSRPSSSNSPPPPIPSIPHTQTGILTKLSRNKRRSYNSSSLNLAGIYECKTCNRTFSSFQALGGHRASHKKLNSTSHHDLVFSPVINPSSPSPLSLQLGNVNYGTAAPTPTTAVAVQSNNKSSSKIHECSICGVEFSSGQALGGHMRRHRGHVIPENPSAAITTTTTITNNTANTTLSLSTAIDVEYAAAGKVEQSKNDNNGFLSLDLNLPASPSQEEAKFSLPPKQQSAAMLFSTPALVDCFY